MTFEEFLQSVEGLSAEQIAAITGGMKENKLYISGEENIDERYAKLKGQHQDASTQLADAQKLIGEMKKQTEGNENLQQQIADYQQKAAEAEERAAKAERDAAIKVGLLAQGAVPEDVDYLMYRIEQGDAEVKVGEDGKLSGLDDAVKNLKTAHPSQFKEEGGAGKFSGNRLPGTKGQPSGGVTKEQFDKMGYQQRLKIFNEDPDMYNELSGNGKQEGKEKCQ